MTNQSVPLREQIAESLARYIGYKGGLVDLSSTRRNRFYNDADQLIKDCHIVQLADDQECPIYIDFYKTTGDAAEYQRDRMKQVQPDGTAFRKVVVRERNALSVERKDSDGTTK